MIPETCHIIHGTVKNSWMQKITLTTAQITWIKPHRNISTFDTYAMSRITSKSLCSSHRKYSWIVFLFYIFPWYTNWRVCTLQASHNWKRRIDWRNADWFQWDSLWLIYSITGIVGDWIMAFSLADLILSQYIPVYIVQCIEYNNSSAICNYVYD